MKIAFYAPMKPPGSAGASGDRAIAALIWQGLEELGHHVGLASALKTWAQTPPDYTPLKERASADAGRLADKSFDLFFTYHNYYKAPDLIGPLVAAKGMPYVIAEPSRAPKRADGPWAEGFAASDAALDAANVLLSISARDRPALEAAGHGAKLAHLPLYSALNPPRSTGPANELICVAMMREGDKLNSYHVLAKALRDAGEDWHLTIVGDGPAREDVEALFKPFGARVTFAGQQDGTGISGLLAKAGTFVWPGCGEGLGLSFLEAQAAGLPCVALDEPGPHAAVGDGGILTTPETYGAAILRLLTNDTAWQNLKEKALARARDVHSREAFLAALNSALEKAR